jgi:uncharacterized membrane protein
MYKCIAEVSSHHLRNTNKHPFAKKITHDEPSINSYQFLTGRYFNINQYHSSNKEKKLLGNITIGDAMGTKSAYHRAFFLITLLFIVAILTVPSLYAENYYADITITVDSSGFVTIEGPTNYPNLTIKNTENYTSKQHSLWILNITKPEMFSEFIYTIILPKGSSINHIKSSGFIRIEEKLGNLVVSGFGENESLSVVIQYQTEKTEDLLLQGNIVYLIILPAIIIVGILFVYFYRKEKTTVSTEKKEIKREPPGDWKGLNHRQKHIMQVLQERNTPMTQTDIQKELQIPKASVSRNIRSLEKKGLIEKETIGMSNLIRLKKT